MMEFQVHDANPVKKNKIKKQNKNERKKKIQWRSRCDVMHTA